MSAVDALIAGAVSPAVDVADFRRDRWDRPLITPTGGGDRRPYTRSSTAAKTIDDDYNLNRWQRGNVAYGVATDTSLAARILAVGGRPDQWGKAEKDAIHEIADEAQRVAQAHKNADIGTAIHKLTERLDAGEHVIAGPYQPDLDAYTRALDAAGLDTHRDWIECRIVCDQLEMAGTADRIVTVRPGSPLIDLYHLHPGEALIADLKTGSSVEFGGLGFTAQLAAYANGQLYDPATDERLDTPAMSKQWGIIIHLPAGRGECTLYAADLVNGLAAAHLANKVREFRKASKGWLQPIAYGSETVTDQALHELLAASLEQQPAGDGSPPVAPVPQVPAETITATTAALRARFRAAVEAGATRWSAWPAGVAYFKDGGPTTWDQVKAVEELVIALEAEAGVPFGDPPLPADPTVPKVNDARDLFAPVQPAPPRLDPPPAEVLEAFSARMRVLPADLKQLATDDAHEHGLPEHRSDWTVEHVDTIELAIGACEYLAQERIDRVRIALADYETDTAQAIRVLAGVADTSIAELVEDQAHLLVLIACALDAGTVIPTDGGLASSETAETALVERHGSKAAVLAAAKDAAPRWGRPKPKSTAQVVSDPVLVAVLTAPGTDPTSNQQGDSQ